MWISSIGFVTVSCAWILWHTIGFKAYVNHAKKQGGKRK